jgi:type VI secretion system secreted protein VgrG
MASYKQSDRLMQFSSPLGKDVLLIESFEGVEGISRLFEFHVELLAESGTSIKPTDLVGHKVTVAIGLNDVQGTRWVTGVVASFEQTSSGGEFDVYHARIVPSMWFLTLNTNCRVFQSMTVVDILKKVLTGEYGLTLSDQTTGSYAQLEYCTQYNESDFHFVSRLMEESGIFYWFEHTDQDNKIHLGDSRNAYADCPLSSSVAYVPPGIGREGAYGSQLTELSSTATMVTGKHSTEDYDFRNYALHKVTSQASTSDFGKNGYEEFFYPAGEEGYVEDTDTNLSSPNLGTTFLGSRALSVDATSEVFRGSSNLRSMCSGYTFSVTKYPRSTWNRKYLLTEVVHRATQVPSYRSDDSGGGGGYGNRFSAVSSDIIYKPLATARKPRVFGPQTAHVVGPSGDEIYVDKYGRVKVQFFWDRAGTYGDVNDGTWVRVAQPWAGNGRGTVFWPRVNDEVVVQFLNGDPDNPVITGSVYNGTNMPPYVLPDHSTQSGIVTRSSKGGSASQSNELRFEDKIGQEQVYLHAEYDMDLTVEHDERRTVGGNDSLIVSGDQMEQIKGDGHLTVGGKLVENIGGDANLTIGSNQTEQVGSNMTIQVGQNRSEKVGMNYSMDAGMQVYIKAGMTLVLEGGVGLTLQAGGNFITIDPMGVQISGTLVMINSGGSALSGSAGEVPSPVTPKMPDLADDGTKFTKMN